MLHCKYLVVTSSYHNNVRLKEDEECVAVVIRYFFRVSFVLLPAFRMLPFKNMARLLLYVKPNTESSIIMQPTRGLDACIRLGFSFAFLGNTALCNFKVYGWLPCGIKRFMIGKQNTQLLLAEQIIEV